MWWDALCFSRQNDHVRTAAVARCLLSWCWMVPGAFFFLGRGMKTGAERVGGKGGGRCGRFWLYRFSHLFWSL